MMSYYLNLKKKRSNIDIIYAVTLILDHEIGIFFNSLKIEGIIFCYEEPITIII